MTPKRDATTQSGFTFVEVILASFISALLVSGAALLWYHFVTTYDFSFETSQAIELATSNVQAMVTELRETRNGEAGEYPLVTLDDQELVFHSDIDNDGDVERVRYYLVGTQLIKQVFNVAPGTTQYACTDGCTVCHNDNNLAIDEHAWPTHYAHGDTLGACGSGSSTGGETSQRVVADYVKNGSAPLFTYYNGNWPGDQTNNPLQPTNRLLGTRLITTSLTIRLSDGSVGAEAVTIENSAHLRNLKDNL